LDLGNGPTLRRGTVHKHDVATAAVLTPLEQLLAAAANPGAARGGEDGEVGVVLVVDVVMRGAPSRDAANQERGREESGELAVAQSLQWRRESGVAADPGLGRGRQCGESSSM